MPWRHCVKVKKKPIAAGKARRPRRPALAPRYLSAPLALLYLPAAPGYSRSSCMRVSQDRQLLHLLRLRGQRAGMATDRVGKSPMPCNCRAAQTCRPRCRRWRFRQFFHVTKRLMRAEGCLLHPHRRIENLHRAAAAGSNVKIRGHIMTAQIDHRHHVRRAATGYCEHTAVRGAGTISLRSPRQKRSGR